MALEGIKYHHNHVFFSHTYIFWDARKDDILHKWNADLTIAPMIRSVPDVKSFREYG